jgi:hypothetical protein
MSDYKYCYLVTGVWIVGKVDHKDAYHFMLSDVRVVQPTFRESTQQVVLQFLPFEMAGQDTVLEIDKSWIVADAHTIPEQLLKGYIENTSRIQMVG